MPERLKKLAEAYTAALQKYVAGAGEEALQTAYNLGREAIVGGVGVLDIATVYQDALLRVLLGSLTQEESTRIAQLAAEFFIESLSPFEMAQQGYQAANTTLALLNEASKERERLLAREQSARAEAEEAQRRLRFLADASTLLDASLDYQTTLSSVARLAVPYIGDWCTVDIVEEDQSTSRVAVAHADPAKTDILLDLQRSSQGELDSLLGIADVLNSGRSKLVSEIPEWITERIESNKEIARIVHRYGLRSYMIVPLLARQRTLGAVTLVAGDSGRHYTMADLRLAEDMARRAALAVDNARLYAESQRAIRARDELLSIVSHDLRNPLGVILMSSMILLRGVQTSGKNPQEINQLDAIKRSAERMNRLIQDLLDVAKIESGHFSVDLKPVSASSLITDAVEMLTPLAEKKSITLASEGDIEALSVQADRERMSQVFSNIVGNAIKFTADNGDIRVTARERDGFVQFSVQDTGPGIPPESLPHIFDRFWQARHTARMGTGLGLSIAKGIVLAHGGTIWAESEIGKGTTFHFTVPSAN